MYLPFSTVQSVLFRFGLDHQLNFVLPPTGNQLNDPKHLDNLLEPFKIEWLDKQWSKIPWHRNFSRENKYDILNLHTVWNKTAIRY